MNNDSQLNEYVLSAYTKLHTIPETALKEYKTSSYISTQLKELGCKVMENIGGSTAVMGILPVKRPGPVIVLRADMDALPYVREDGTHYASHTCGHDAHSSMVLACAKKFADEGGLPFGELRVLFQPAEETMQGARLVIQSRAISDADALVGIHLRPSAEAGLHQATPELRHGSVCHLKVKIIGKASHAGRPHQGINALEAASLAVIAVKMLPFDPAAPHSVKVTNISCGDNASNIIPAYADIVFDLRTQSNAEMDSVLEKTINAIESAAAGIGARAELISRDRAMAAQYDDVLCACAKRAIEKVLGQALPPVFTTGSEDFHLYATELGLRSVYIGLGAGMKEGLHSEKMSFDTAALSDGVHILSGTVLEILDQFEKNSVDKGVKPSQCMPQ